MEFNDQGDLKNIVNLAKNLTVLFTEQGLYWYASKYPCRLFFSDYVAVTRSRYVRGSCAQLRNFHRNCA